MLKSLADLFVVQVGSVGLRRLNLDLDTRQFLFVGRTADLTVGSSDQIVADSLRYQCCTYLQR